MKQIYFLLSIVLIVFSCQEETPPVTSMPPVAVKSTAKDITKFSFGALSPAIDAAIDGSTKAITSTLPGSTDLTKLVPTITLSDKATVSPGSGTAQDFSKEVSYTVTAEDGSTAVYKVNLKKEVVAVVVSTDKLPSVFEDLGDGVDYVIKSQVNIDKDVEIKPGVTIEFDNGSFWVSDKGTLRMVGTKEKPIVLDGIKSTKNAWKGVFVSSSSIKNVWEYVTLKNSNGTVYSNTGILAGLLVSTRAKISIKRCTFSENDGYGLSLDGSTSFQVFTAFEENVFTGNKNAGLNISTGDMGSIDSKSTFQGNGKKYIEVFSKFFEFETVVQKTDVPFRINSIIQIAAKLTFNAGASVEFGSDAGLYTAESVKTAALVVNGTEKEPVKFTGYIPDTKGVWAGIVLSTNNIENKLSYSIIDGAGSVMPTGNNLNFRVDKTATAALVLDGTGYRVGYRCSISNCTVKNTAGYGIAYPTYGKDAVVIKDNVYKDNTKDNVFTYSY